VSKGYVEENPVGDLDALLSSIKEYRLRAEKKIGELREMLEKIGKTPCRAVEALSVVGELVDKTRREVGQLLGEIESLERRVNTVFASLQKALNGIRRELERELSTRERLREGIRDIHALLRIAEIVSSLRESLARLESLERSIEERKAAMRVEVAAIVEKAYRDLEELSRVLRESIVRDIGGKAYQVLEALYSIGRQSLPERLSELVGILADRTGLPPGEVLESLLTLDKKNYWPLVVRTGSSTARNKERE